MFDWWPNGDCRGIWRKKIWSFSCLGRVALGWRAHCCLPGWLGQVSDLETKENGHGRQALLLGPAGLGSGLGSGLNCTSR